MPALPRKILISGLRMLAVLLLLGGGAWFVTSLSYDDEQPRVQANEGPAAVADIMDSLQFFYADHGRLPQSGEFQASLPKVEEHVAVARVNADYSFTITYSGRRQIDHKTLTLHPYADGQQHLHWRCESPSIDPRWWPDYCRTQPAS
jgi:hypothetical protein